METYFSSFQDLNGIKYELDSSQSTAPHRFRFRPEFALAPRVQTAFLAPEMLRPRMVPNPSNVLSVYVYWLANQGTEDAANAKS